jgi:hypothetical protein
MSTSKDCLAGAQDVKRCQLCPGKDIKSAAEIVCNTCHVDLCKECVGQHMTFNPTIRHDVVTFESRRFSILPSPCKRHKDRNCEMFCEDCDSLVCLKCLVSGTHENHQVSQVSEIHSSRKEQIERDTEELETKIAPILKSILSELEEMFSNVVEKHAKRQQAITEFGNKCHTLVERVVDKYLSESKKMETEDRDSLQTMKSEFEELQTSIQSAIDEKRTILDSNDFSKVINYTSRNKNLKIIPPRFTLSIPPFDPTELTEQSLRQFFGDIPTTIKTDIPGQVLQGFQDPASIANEPKKKVLETPELVEEIHTGYDETYRLHCVSNTDEFYVSGNSKIIKRLKSEGRLLGGITTKSGILPYDLTVTKEGHLVYSDWGDRSINLLMNGEIKCLIRLHGWRPWAICSTSNDDLLATMRSDSEPSKVVRYSGSTVKQEIQRSDTGKPLYSGPDFITENKNLDIVVSDWNTKTVVVVNWEGTFRFSYDGNSRVKKPFNPRGVTTDSMCHILIADHDNQAIHIIDQNGRFLRYIDNCDLHRPYDLSTATDDVCFVSERKTGIVKQIKYLE